jgi:hypothetical protein
MYAATNAAPKADGRVVPWNKGKLIGQKPPLKLKEIWAASASLRSLLFVFTNGYTHCGAIRRTVWPNSESFRAQ